MFPIQKLRLLEGTPCPKIWPIGSPCPPTPHFVLLLPVTVQDGAFFFLLSIQFTHFILLFFCLVVHSFLRTLLSPSVHSWSILFGAAASHHHCLLLVFGCSTELKNASLNGTSVPFFFFATKSLPEREVGLFRYRILSKRWIKRSNYLHYLSIYLRYGYTISGTGILSRLESHRASGGGQCPPTPKSPTEDWAHSPSNC